MEEYLVPTGFGEDEFVEKKSRFLGRVWPADTEAEALAHIEEMRKQHYDATHNCWAYIIRDGATRFSDDGEPGGTAGMPMVQVLQKEENRLYIIILQKLQPIPRTGNGKQAGENRRVAKRWAEAIWASENGIATFLARNTLFCCDLHRNKVSLQTFCQSLKCHEL